MKSKSHSSFILHPSSFPSSWQSWLLLIAILFLAAYFRFLNLYGWDGINYRAMQHPDERFIAYTAYNLQVPRSFGDYLRSSCLVNGQVPNPRASVDLAGRQLSPENYEPSIDSGCNTLNPRNYGWSSMFVYGSFPTTLTRVIAERYYPEGQTITPNQIRDVGRTQSMFFDLGSILLIFLIGRRLYGSGAGLIAAFLYACSALPIQLAHFFTVDAATGFFTLLTIYWAVRIARGGGIFSFIMLGVAVGGAMACRITMATLGMTAVLAVVQRIWEERQLDGRTYIPRSNIFFDLSLGFVLRMGGLLILSGLMALLTFRLLAPDTFVGTSFFDLRPEPRFLENIMQASGFVNGSIDAPFSQQWANRTPFLFPLSNMVIWGMGLPFGLAAWLCWAVAGWQMLRRRMLRHLIPFSWIGFYFAWQGGQFGMTMRYYALLYGLFAVLAAWGLLAFGAWLGRFLATKRERAHFTAKTQRRKEHANSANLLAEQAAKDDSQAPDPRPLTPGSQTPNPKPQTPLAWVPLGIVLLGTLLWAGAFTAIYRQPHTRLAASQWIYANVPAGTTISAELWDDPLPVAPQSSIPVAYKTIMLHPYAEDEQSKYLGSLAADGTQTEGFIDQLGQIDYLILASNRIYDSATRLPMRYPSTTRYYHYLFNGELGFELVADFHSYPALFGISFPDQGAEEAFSVYDHPRVLIFKRTAAFSKVRAEELLTSDVAFGEVYKTATVEVKKAPTALRLTDLQWALYRAGGTWSQLFDQQGLASRVPWLFWLLLIELLGLAAFVLLFRPLAMLPDHGFSLSKILGLLLVSYLAWLLASLRVLQFEPRTIWSCVVVLLLGATLSAWLGWQELRTYLRHHWRSLLIAEALFLLSFAAMLGLRSLNPDLWHANGTNRLAELANLTAVTKSAAFPPYDPWFAGGYLNIPYFGYVLVAVLMQLTGSMPGVGYNLGIATMFALASLAAWGVGYNLGVRGLGSRVWGSRKHQTPDTRHKTASAEAGFEQGTGEQGNRGAGEHQTPDTRHQTPDTRHETASAEAGFEQDSRKPQAPNLKPKTLNVASREAIISGLLAAACVMLAGPISSHFMLPYGFGFSLFGVLGEASMALPLQMAVLGLLLALVQSNLTQRGAGWRYWLLPLGLLALVIGALKAASRWDAQALLILIALTFVGLYLSRYSYFGLRLALAQILIIWLLSSLLFLPFSRSYAAELGRFRLQLDERATSLNMLASLGVWLFVLSSAAALVFRRARRLGLMPILSILLLFGLIIGLVSALNMSALVPLGLIMAAGLLVLFDLIVRLKLTVLDENHIEPGPITLMLFIWALLAIGLVLLSVFLAFRGEPAPIPMLDVTGMLSWNLLALCAGLALSWVWRELGRRTGGLRWAWRVPALLLGLAVLSSTVLGISDHIAAQNQKTMMGLDGAASARQGSWNVNNAQIALQDDTALIDWMHANIQGTPIVLEGLQDGNPWSGRVAALTGLPTLLARPALANQQRSVAFAQPVIQYRQDLVSWIYSSNNGPEVLRHLKLYGIEYVYVGPLEQALYPAAGLQLFDQFVASGAAKLVQSAGQTRLYHILDTQNPPALLTTTLPVKAPANTTNNPPAMLKGRVGDLPDVGLPGKLGQGAASSQIVAIVVWLLLFYALLLLGLPLAMVCFDRGGRWSDAGYAWARLIGLLLLGYAVWLPTSLGLWYYDWRGSMLGAGLIVLLNLLIVLSIGYRRQAGAGNVWQWLLTGVRGLGSRLGQYRGRILQIELLFLLSFGFMLLLRAMNPDLWQPYWGGEKPFEFGLLNAILRSPVMPPYSPFFSDGTINYYYYGIFLVSLPIKLGGIAPAVGFNLVIATVYALFCTGLFALGARISGRAWVGIAAIILVAIFGNLAAFFAAGWSQGIGPLLTAMRDNPANIGEALGSWFVGPSRVIPNTINEFPFWGFLFADLHPHLIAMPMTLLVIGLVYMLGVGGRDSGVRGAGEPTKTQATSHATGFAQNSVQTQNVASLPQNVASLPQNVASLPQNVASLPQNVASLLKTQNSLPHSTFNIQHSTFALLALTLGTLAVTNSWDLPSYALLLAGVLLIKGWRSPGSWLRRVLRMLGGLMSSGAIVLTGLLLFTPFFTHFVSPVGGLGLVTSPTTLRDYLLIYGIFLAILLPMILDASRRILSKSGEPQNIASGVEPQNIASGVEPQNIASGVEPQNIASGVKPQNIASGVKPQNIASGVKPQNIASLRRTQNIKKFFRVIVIFLGFVLVAGIGLAILAPILAQGIQPTTGLAGFAEDAQAWFGPRLWALVLFICALPVLLSRRVSMPTWFTIWLAALGLAVSVGIELVYIKDHLKGGDWYRMNTVFKFGVQIWILLGLAAALSLPALLRRISQRSYVLSVPYGMLLLALAGLGLVYLLVGVPSRVAYRFPKSAGMTLDGLAFLEKAVYYIFPGYLGQPEGSFTPIPIQLRYDGEAIRWLNENVSGTPVVLQSSAEFYRLYGVRIAANTGLPTIVSPLHEAEQRNPDLVWERERDVQQIYRTSNTDEALRLMAKYHVAYIVVGPIERIVYGEAGTQKFEDMSGQEAGLPPRLQVVYQNEQVAIYSVDPAVYDRIEQSSGSNQAVDTSSAELLALERQHKADPDNIDLIWKLAQAYANAGRPEDGAAVLEPLVQAKPDDVLVQHVYGDLLADAGKNAEAEAAYRRAVEIDPSAGNMVKLADGLIRFGKIDAAEEVLAQATSIDPNLASAQCSLGRIAETRARIEQARAFYQRCLELARPGEASRREAEQALERLK